MTQIVLTPIGRVRSNVTDPKEDYWGNIVSVIEFEKGQLESGALKGLEDFSHVEVLFHLSDVPESSIERGGRHPRNNPNWPKVGILAQRGKARPNRIAATICQVIEVSQTSLTVRGLDAFDGSPVLDLKPVFSEFLPDKTRIKQPQWSHEMMENYFQCDISGK
ncbi:MAG: TrmO family methyltransferase [Terriglobales bacterium]